MEKIFNFSGGPFSQWALTPFTEFDEIFNTAEQFMMASKAKLFEDEETFKKIMKSENPSEQKMLGRSVKNFDEEKWNNVARDYVTLGNYNKFTQNADLLEMLLEKQDYTFVEVSKKDRIWGSWEGDGYNWLGKCINRVLDIILTDDLEAVDGLRSLLDWRSKLL